MSARPRRRPRRNPPLIIVGNPPRVITRDVKAIVYRHAADGELYVHGFGPRGEDIRLEDLRDGVAIRRLPTGRTGCAAIALQDGSVLLKNTSGKRLWADL